MSKTARRVRLTCPEKWIPQIARRSCTAQASEMTSPCPFCKLRISCRSPTATPYIPPDNTDLLTAFDGDRDPLEDVRQSCSVAHLNVPSWGHSGAGLLSGISWGASWGTISSRVYCTTAGKISTVPAHQTSDLASFH